MTATLKPSQPIMLDRDVDVSKLHSKGGGQEDKALPQAGLLAWQDWPALSPPVYHDSHKLL